MIAALSPEEDPDPNEEKSINLSAENVTYNLIRDIGLSGVTQMH